jgi:hypothetical protein
MRAVLWLLFTVSTPAGVAWSQGAQKVVTAVWVHDVPGPPKGDFWHPAGAFNVLNLKSVYPNVELCAHPYLGGERVCASICWSFEGDAKLGGRLKSKECQRPLHLVLPASDRRMRIEVTDMNNVLGQPQFHATIAQVGLTDPSTCPDAKPCELVMPKGSLVLSFTLAATTAPAAAAPGSGKCQEPSTQWPHQQSGLHGPYTSVEDAMNRDAAGGLAFQWTDSAEYGYLIVRDRTQKSGGYYTTPPALSSQLPGPFITPRVTQEDYERSLANAFAGSCANAENFYIAATVHTHPPPVLGEQLLAFIDNFSEPDFNQAIRATKVPVPSAGTAPVCKTLTSAAAASSAAPSAFEKIVMIDKNDGKVRTFTAQSGDRVIPDDQISSISLIVRFNQLWQCYSNPNRVKVIGHYNSP